MQFLQIPLPSPWTQITGEAIKVVRRPPSVSHGPLPVWGPRKRTDWDCRGCYWGCYKYYYRATQINMSLFNCLLGYVWPSKNNNCSTYDIGQANSNSNFLLRYLIYTGYEFLKYVARSLHEGHTCNSDLDHYIPELSQCYFYCQKLHNIFEDFSLF